MVSDWLKGSHSDTLVWRRMISKNSIVVTVVNRFCLFANVWMYREFFTIYTWTFTILVSWPVTWLKSNASIFPFHVIFDEYVMNGSCITMTNSLHIKWTSITVIQIYFKSKLSGIVELLLVRSMTYHKYAAHGISKLLIHTCRIFSGLSISAY